MNDDLLLVCYTRRPSPDARVRSPRVAYSLHLAVRDGGGWTPLHRNRGIAYASAVPTEHRDVAAVRTLRDPRFVRTASGALAVLARRALDDGAVDPSADDRLLLFVADDRLEFAPAGLIDAAAAAELAAVDGVKVALPADLDAVDVGGAIRIDRPTARALETRYGRIRNVEVAVPELRLGVGDALELTALRADLGYSDGSRAERAVDWDPASAIDTTVPGVHRIEGAVRQRSYPFPFIAERADPTILEYQGRYYFIATDEVGGDNMATFGLLIRVADDIAGLRTAEDHRIVGIGPAGIGGCFWAPELHVIGGSLRVLFAPSIGDSSWHHVQCHVMTLRGGGDPTVAADWSVPEPVLTAEGLPLQLDADHPGISLDMTYIEDAGRSYVAWSQRYIDEVVGDAEVWIASIDPARPTRLTSAPVRVITALCGWDMNDAPVAEGPFAIHHGDELHLVYSGSGVGPTYALGSATARSGSDLLDLASWSIHAAPLLETDDAETQWGPGHNSFCRDEDGVELIVYHAKQVPEQSPRDVAVRRIHWGIDGRLVVDMADDEEVAPHLRRVATTVRITDAAEVRR